MLERSTLTPPRSLAEAGERGFLRYRIHGPDSCQNYPDIALHSITPSVIIVADDRQLRRAETERVFRAELSRRLPPTIQRVARRKLLAIHAATELRELTVPPGNLLEALKGNRKAQHSVRVNDQWRICFRWREGNAYDVEIVDYH